MNITDRSVAGIKNYKIVKSNKLINSKHTLSPLQWRLILLTAAQIRKDDTEFNECCIGLRELFDLKKGDKISDKYNQAREAAVGLTNSSVYIQKGKHWVAFPFVTKAEGNEGEDFIKIRFAQEMKPFFLQLNAGEYTAYKPINCWGFVSGHSFRLYELLIQYFPNINKRNFTLDSFKNLLNVEDKYKRFSDLKRRVIEPAVHDINSYEPSGMFVEYEIKRRGRSVTDIIFYMSKKGNALVSDAAAAEMGKVNIEEPAANQAALNFDKVSAEEVVPIPNLSEDEEILAAIGFKAKNKAEQQKALEAISHLIRQYGLIQVHKKVFVVQQAANVSSPIGYLTMALKDDYQLKEPAKATAKASDAQSAYVQNKQKEQQARTAKVLHKKKQDAISKEFDKFWKDLCFQYLNENIFGQYPNYVAYLNSDASAYERKFLEEWNKNKPSAEAKKYFGRWIIGQIGTKEHQAYLKEGVKYYAQKHHDFDWDAL
ncbi:replication initiation protein [Persicobacter psychrovividus]|uniref:Initiator Rep protein WH1 domain-containing protein n=1 Tax=Persicobacter psychrovividus TaxID=387638 RepID=A0ABN6LES9_9BACT|nr:hypothetical protein PEPS_39780 [Persicobacter psychrovividus]